MMAYNRSPGFTAGLEDAATDGVPEAGCFSDSWLAGLILELPDIGDLSLTHGSAGQPGVQFGQVIHHPFEHGVVRARRLNRHGAYLSNRRRRRRGILLLNDNGLFFSYRRRNETRTALKRRVGLLRVVFLQLLVVFLRADAARLPAYGFRSCRCHF